MAAGRAHAARHAESCATKPSACQLATRLSTRRGKIHVLNTILAVPGPSATRSATLTWRRRSCARWLGSWPRWRASTTCRHRRPRTRASCGPRARAARSSRAWMRPARCPGSRPALPRCRWTPQPARRCRQCAAKQETNVGNGRNEVVITVASSASEALARCPGCRMAWPCC